MSAPPAGAQPALDKLIIVGRSDGRRWTTEEIKARLAKDRAARQTGEPIHEDPNQVSDKETRKKLELWKVISARGVAEELRWPQDSKYQLKFPDGFCLRERTPLGAGSEKREFGMYGHMAGCAEDFVYREPYEFVPHVLWLLSDSTDQKNCPCKPCCRATGRPIAHFVERLKAEIKELEGTSEEPKAAEPKAIKKAVGGNRPTTTRKKTSATTDAGPKTTTTTATTTAARATKKATTPKPTPTSRPSQSQSTMPSSVAQPGPVAIPAAVAAAAAAATPARYNDEPTLFRRGEMVWCQQLGAQGGWRIGVIREVRAEGPAGTLPYVIIGLGHSSIDLPDSEREEKHLRPFLTFSVPAVTNPHMKSNDYSYVEWENVLADTNFTREMVGLEASKLAAMEIDGSWSTFNKLPAGPNQNKLITRYAGAFLGAEMIRLGDPIRNKLKNLEMLLEVTEIFVTEIESPTAPNPPYKLSFRGVEYEAVLMPETANIPAQPQGAIFVKDTAFRTLAARAGGKKIKCVWQAKKFDSVWEEDIVAGRSYATDELLTVTKGADEVKKAYQTGEFQEASAYLNNRMQPVAALYQGRKPSRWATYSQAVHESHQQLRVGDDIVEEDMGSPF